MRWVVSRYIRSPSAKMSTRQSKDSPASNSGASEPLSAFRGSAVHRPVRLQAKLAPPKSSNLMTSGAPSDITRKQLARLTLQWTMHCSCAAIRARQICLAIVTTLVQCIGPSSASVCSRLSPSRCAITRYATGSPSPMMSRPKSMMSMMFG